MIEDATRKESKQETKQQTKEQESKDRSDDTSATTGPSCASQLIPRVLRIPVLLTFYILSLNIPSP